MKEKIKVKSQLDLLFFALDRGVSTIRDGLPLYAFVLTLEKGEISLNKFVVDDYGRSLSKARRFILQLQDESVYALAFSGYVTVNGKKNSVVIVEGPEGVIIAQQYVLKSKSSRFRKIGNPISLGVSLKIFDPKRRIK